MKQLLAALIALFATPALADFTSSDMLPPPQAELDRVLADPDCELFNDTALTDMWEGTTLNANTRVHIVPCFMGAYNVMSKVLLERRDDESNTSTFDTLSFADYRSDLGWIGTDLLTNAFFNPETGHLAHFHKGRGVGDCGATGSWKWTGYVFALVEYYVEEDCNGRLPDQWPQVFANPAFAAAPTAMAVAEDCLVAPYCEDRRYFKDFLVSCRAPEADGARFCSANAYVHNVNAPAGFDYQLRVSRERRDAPLRVSLIAVDEFLNRSKPLQIKVDGEQVAFLNPDEIETYQAINDYFIGPQDVTDHVIEAMKAGSQIEFAYTGENGARLNIPFSLAGLTASLLWMQENAGI